MNDKVLDIIKIANDFLKVPSSIGFEKPFLNYLNNKIVKLGYETILTDRYLVVKPKNKKIKPNYLFSAHIDRHAVIKNELGQVEYLSFYIKKKLNIKFKRELLREKEIKLLEYLQKDNYVSSVDENFFFIEKNDVDLKFICEGGANFFENIALRYVGDYIYSYDVESGKKVNEFKILRYDIDSTIPIVTYQLDSKPLERDTVFSMKSEIKIMDDVFFGQIDNVISVALLYYLLKSMEFTNEIIFTTREEVGRSYECVIDYLRNKKGKIELIDLDVTPYKNFDNLQDGTIILREGDENGMFSNKLVEKVKKIAQLERIPYSFKSVKIGVTELGRLVQYTKGKLNGITIQLPSKNFHTTYETSTLKCLESYLKIIKKLNE